MERERMTKIKKLIDDFSDELKYLTNKYVTLMDELKSYCSATIDNSENDEIYKKLNIIKDVFIELYPALHFIMENYDYALGTDIEFKKFVEKVGGTVTIYTTNKRENGTREDN